MKPVSVAVMDAFCEIARLALDPDRVPPMTREERIRFEIRSKELDDELWARIQSDEKPQGRLALN